MKFIQALLVTLFVAGGSLSAAEATHTIKEVKGLPEGLSEKVAATLHETGYRVSGPDGVICVIWPGKELAVKAGFKPSLSVAYPFTNGQLLGAIQFPEGTTGHDFRAQEITSGVYTLRYGQQPEDGNHLGTSEIRDFCLALPAAEDTDPKPVFDPMKLNQTSAEAAGSAHPAIFLMSAPPEKPEKKAKLIHDEEKDFWVLQLSTMGKTKEKAAPVTLRIVTVGLGE